MTQSRRAQLRNRTLGLTLIGIGIALVLWIAAIGSARLDEIDALGTSGYYLPTDFVLAGACVAALIGGSVLVWRARD